MQALSRNDLSEDAATLIVRSLDIDVAASRPYVASFPGQRIQSLCIGLSSRHESLTTNTMKLSSVFGFLPYKGCCRFC